MVVVVFDSQPQAHDGMLALKQLDREGTISVHSGSVIKKNSDGATELLKTKDEFPIGAVGGTAIGSLIGLLGGPVGVFVGATSGTFLGAFHDLYRSGISAEFVNDISAKLTPGKFAVVADISEEWITPLDVKMEHLGGQVFRTRKGYVEIDQVKGDIAALDMKIKLLETEMKEARDERKAKLQAKFDKLKEERRKKMEQTKQRLEQIKKELDMRRDRIKKEFERRTQEFGKNVEHHREKMNAYKKKKNMDIARIEQSFDKNTAALLKKRLGEEKFWRLQKWLLEKRKRELQRFENEIHLTEEEDYDRQSAKLQETDPKNLIWIYYLDNKSKFKEELERDTGTSRTFDGPIGTFHPGF